MNERNKISDLIEFIQKAIKLAKYNSNTGGGILYAVRAAEKGLLPEEPKEIEYLASHLEELFFRQKDLNLSPQSQDVYFTRIRRVVEDYKKYGHDAKAIYSWAPKLRAKKDVPKKNVSSGKNDNDKNEWNEGRSSEQTNNNTSNNVIREVGGIKLNVVTWRLRPGVLVKIELPEDLTKADVERIKKLLDLEIEIFD
jgi:hypothetical protein